MNTSRLAPASNQSGNLTSSQRLLWRLLGGLALAGLIGWLLLLNLGDGNETQPYRSFTPQEAASQCAVETGITANSGLPIRLQSWAAVSFTRIHRAFETK